MSLMIGSSDGEQYDDEWHQAYAAAEKHLASNTEQKPVTNDVPTIIDDGTYDVNAEMLGHPTANHLEGLDRWYIHEAPENLKQQWLKMRQDYIDTIKKQKDLPQGEDIKSAII